MTEKTNNDIIVLSKAYISMEYKDRPLNSAVLRSEMLLITKNDEIHSIFSLSSEETINLFVGFRKKKYFFLKM